MAFSGESEFANQKSRFQQGRKSNSTPNAYKTIVILITRAKVMVLWSLTKNQSKMFLNLSTQTIPTAPAIFSIKFNVLEVGEKMSSQNKPRSYQNKNPEVKCQIQTLFMHYSLLQMTLFTHAVTLFTLLHRQHAHYTKQKHTGMETDTELNITLTSQWTYTNSTTLELHTHQTTEHKHTEILLWTKRLVPGNGAKFDRGHTPPN